MSQMKTVMPVEMVEELAGHRGYLSDAYRRYSKAQIAAEYNKAYYAISLHSSENVPEIKAELESAKTGQQYLLSQMVNNASEMDSLKKQMKDMQDRMERMQGVGALIQENKDAIEAERKRREREKQ